MELQDIIPPQDIKEAIVVLQVIEARMGQLEIEDHKYFDKDRIAYEMLKALEVDDKTVVEPSSGNTGIALACIANAMGVPVEIAVPERIPEEKKVRLRFLGAKVI